MKKLMIIICIFFLVACEPSSSQINNDSSTTDEQLTVLKIQQINTLASVYSDIELMHEITILSAEEVLSVKEVYILDEKIVSYKVELKYGTIAYVKADAFYIIDTLTDDYNVYLTPKIDLSQIHFGKEIFIKDFIDAYMIYDLYVNDEVVEDGFTFIAGMRYEIYAKAYDRSDMTYISSTEIIDTEVDHIYCKVRESKDVASKELTRILLYSDYKHRVVSCEISYKNNQIEIWYGIELDDGTIGFSNDKLYHLNDLDHISILTSTETIEIDNSDFTTFEAMPSVVQIDSQSSDEIHLIDFASGSHNLYYGVVRFFDEDIVIVDQYDRYDASNRWLSLFMFVDGQLNEVTKTENMYTSFENIEKDYYGNINFEAHFEKDLHWPLNINNEYIQYASFKLQPSGYRLKTRYNYNFDEPLLENVALYNNNSNTKEKIDTFNSIDIFSFENMKTIDIIEDQTVFWFKVVTEDGRQGYAFRPVFDYELNLINLNSYKFKLSDGSMHRFNEVDMYNDDNKNYILTNDLAPIGLYTFIINSDFTQYNNSIDTNGFGLDFKKMVTDHSKSPNQEMIVSKFFQEYYQTVDESDLTIYDNNYNPYYNVTIMNAKSSSFIWLDENTISFFMTQSAYEYDSTDYPSVLRRVDNQWLIESDYTDYVINRNDKK